MMKGDQTIDELITNCIKILEYNNYKIEKPNLNQTCDFSKLKGKSLSFTLNHKLSFLNLAP